MQHNDVSKINIDIDPLTSLPFDLYVRNNLVSDYMHHISRSRMKILDVGGRGGGLGKFLSGHEVYVLDKRRPENNDKEGKYIVGSILEAPFAYNSFDVVVSMDMLEHLEPEDRVKAVQEMIKISKLCVVIGAPFDTELVATTENIANDYFVFLTGEDHKWLKEHIDKSSLPCIKEIEDFLNSNHLRFVKVAHGNLLLWHLMQSFVFWAYRFSMDPKKVESVYRFYNLHWKEIGDLEPPCYRHIFFVTKDQSIDIMSQEHVSSCHLPTEEKAILRSQLINLIEVAKAEGLKEKEAFIDGINRTIAFKILGIYIRYWERVISNNLLIQGIRYLKREGIGRMLQKSMEMGYLPRLISLPYDTWIKRNEPSREELEIQKKENHSFKYRPKISIVSPIYNTPEEWLRLALNSVLNQSYSNWELCVVDGGSTETHVRKVLDEYRTGNDKIKVRFLTENKGIVGNSNEALSMATGEFIALLDHDDELAPFALYEVVKLLNESPHVDFIYSDRDKITLSGRRVEPFFKPDWSPDYFLSCNYLCHLTVIRKSIVVELGGFRPGYDGAQDYDLFLRVTERSKRIARIPKILYHWRISGQSAASGEKVKPYAYEAAKRALSDAMSRRGIKAKILDGAVKGTYRIKYPINKDQKVSIIIPTRDKVDLLKRCIESITSKSTYGNYEILIVDNQSEEDETIEYFERIESDHRIRIVRYNKPFNYSAINNYASLHCSGSFLLFLNNDTEVITPEWIEALVEYAQREDVGAVGAKLLYPNKHIQHAGVILGIGGVAGHSHKHFSRNSLGAGDGMRLATVQNYSAVTAACIMLRRSVFVEIEGFDERFSHAFNDVDLCMRIREKGYLIVYTPYAELFHHESLSRGYEDTIEKQMRFKKEIELFKRKWDHSLSIGDPYYNPNLTLAKEDFSIRI